MPSARSPDEAADDAEHRRSPASICGLTIRLLGRVQFLADGEPLAGFESARVRALLAYLALERGGPHRREALADFFWPEAPEAVAMRRLRQALVNLRVVLNVRNTTVPALLIERDAVAWNPACPVDVDVMAFTTLWAACSQHNHRNLESCRACLDRLTRAIDLYKGPFLAGFTLADSPAFDDWQQGIHERLQDQAVAALASLAAAAERRRDFSAATVHARRQVELQPWNEEALRRLIRTLALGGHRSAALRQYQNCRRALERELGVEPEPETEALYRQVRSGKLAAPVPPPHNLPATFTSFVGRSRELDDLEALLARERLITLTGAGGSGKTRLALELARQVLPDFPGGVWWVDLAPLSDPNLVAPAVAHSLGLRVEGSQRCEAELVRHLKERQSLLILDNVEHLIIAVSRLVSELAAGCSGLCSLATSREPLQIEGEAVVSVHPLSLPPLVPANLGEHDLDAVSAAEAVALFVARAEAARPGFRLTAETAGPVAGICRQLDGLPLALELAAARLRGLSVVDLHQRLSQRLDLFRTGGPSHRTHQDSMRAVLDWSHGLLSEQEQYLFRRLTVFVGPWTLEAAEYVCVGEGIAEVQVAGLVAGLVEKSMVVFDADKYRLLETVRLYGAEKLDRAGERPSCAPRHRDWCLELLERQVAGHGQREKVRLLDSWYSDLRAAIAHCFHQGDGDHLSRLAVGLTPYWLERAYLSEGRGWLERAVSLGSTAEPAMRGPLLACLGAVVLQQADFATSEASYAEALALYRGTGDRRAMLGIILRLAYALRLQAKFAEEEMLLNEGLALARKLGDEGQLGATLKHLADSYSWQHRVDEAMSLWRQSLPHFRAAGDDQGYQYSLQMMAGVCLHDGRYDEAEQLMASASGLAEGPAIQRAVWQMMSGWLAWSRLDLDQAFQLSEESLTSFGPEQKIPHVSGVLLLQAYVYWRRREFSSAVAPLRRLMSFAKTGGQTMGPWVLAYSLDAGAVLAASGRQHLGPAAVSLLAASRALTPPNRRWFFSRELLHINAAIEQQVTDRLGTADAERARTRGAGMTKDEAVELLASVIGDLETG